MVGFLKPKQKPLLRLETQADSAEPVRRSVLDETMSVPEVIKYLCQPTGAGAMGRYLDEGRYILETASRTSIAKFVELLLRDTTHQYSCRPEKTPSGSFIFRESPKIWRHGWTGSDRWVNSGGKRGSRLLPSGTPRVRVRYGKVISRIGLPHCKYHEYVLVAEGNPEFTNAELSRHLFHVIPGTESNCKSATPRLPIKSLADVTSGWKEMAIAKILAEAEVCAAAGQLNLEIVTILLIRGSHDSAHRRPKVIRQSPKLVYVETSGTTRKLAQRRDKSQDKWMNSGGKNAVVTKTAANGVEVFQRKGKITRRDPDDAVSTTEYCYYQFNLKAQEQLDSSPYNVFWVIPGERKASKRRALSVPQTLQDKITRNSDSPPASPPAWPKLRELAQHCDWESVIEVEVEA